MSSFTHLPLDRARSVRWKNGRGVTRELALWPDGSSFERGDFDARISAARVDASGEFSSFPGCERILVVTSGAGLWLEHGASAPRTRVRAFEPYRFSGDWPTRGELVGGACEDFNLIFRRERARAEVECVALGERRLRESFAASDALLFAVSGSVVARATGEEEPFELASGDSLIARELRAQTELELLGRSEDTRVIWVRLERG